MDAYSGTKPVAEQHAFDIAVLQAHLEGHLDGFRGPLTVEQFKGGQSNPTFKLITARHRLGLLTPELAEKVLAARRYFREHLPPHQADAIAFFEPDEYNIAITIQENVIFGKVAYGQAQASQRIAALIAELIDQLQLRPGIMAVGLDSPVGIAGGRLSLKVFEAQHAIFASFKNLIDRLRAEPGAQVGSERPGADVVQIEVQLHGRDLRLVDVPGACGGVKAVAIKAKALHREDVLYSWVVQKVLFDALNDFQRPVGGGPAGQLDIADYVALVFFRQKGRR